MPLCECLADGAEYFDKGQKVFPLHANDSTLDAIEERLLHVRRRDHEDYVRLHAIIESTGARAKVTQQPHEPYD